MRRHLALTALLTASSLASCSAAERTRVDGSELCANVTSFAGREIWLNGPIDPRSTILFRNDGALSCPGGSCCGFATYVYGFGCPGVNIVIVPESLAREPAPVEDPNVDRLLACGSLSDGSESGGACRPTSCALGIAPNVTGITAVRGTLATSTHDPMDWPVLTNSELQPILVFVAREVELSSTALDPVDANFGPDAAL